MRIVPLAILLPLISGLASAATAKPAPIEQEAAWRHLVIIFNKELNPETAAGVNLGRGNAVTACGTVKQPNVYVVEQEILVSLLGDATACDLVAFFVEDKEKHATEPPAFATAKKGDKILLVRGTEKEIVRGSVVAISPADGSIITDIESGKEDIGAGLWSARGFVGIVIKSETVPPDEKKTFAVGLPANKVRQFMGNFFPPEKK